MKYVSYGQDILVRRGCFIHGQSLLRRDRLRECCKALLLHKDKDIKYIMGSGIDVLKLKTSMRLFNKVSPNDVFEEVLDAFF